ARQLEAELVEGFAALGDLEVRLQHAARLLEGQPVAVQERLETQRHRPEPSGLRRGTPLPEALRLIVEVEAVADRRQVGPERAAAFEAAEDLVVVLDEPELDGRRKILAVGPAEEAARADPGDDPLDEREFGEKQLLAGHGAPGDGSMIWQVAGGAHRRAGPGLGPGGASARARVGG